MLDRRIRNDFYSGTQILKDAYMNITLIPNGVLVSRNCPQPEISRNSPYRGVAFGIPWPLGEQEDLDKQSLEMSESVKAILRSYPVEADSYPLEIISDTEIAQRYINACISNGIVVRVMLCETSRSFPRLDGRSTKKMQEQSTLLGYDYINNDFTYSAVYDDLNPSFSESAKELSLRLNQNGLFSDLDDLAYYIELRWKFAETEDQLGILTHGSTRISPLEDSIELIPCAVWELNSPLS